MNYLDPATLRLSAFFGDYFKPLFLRGRSPRTIQLYLTSLRTLDTFLRRPAVVADLSDETINRFLSWFRDLPRSPASVNKEHANITAIWRFACRKNLLTIWPDVCRDPQPKRVPIAWLPHELDQLWAAVRKQQGWIGCCAAADWWAALLSLAWDSGERITAIRSLTWKDVDLRGGWVVFQATTRKGGRSDEAYKLHPDTIAALEQIRFPRREEVLPWPYNTTYLWNRYTEVLKLAGLPTDRRSKFHRIRRSVGSYVKAAGGDPTEALRHSDSRTTRAYLDPRIVTQQQSVDYLFRPHGSGPG